MKQPFKDDGKIRLVEIFHSLQGEGEAIGYPALFVRLAGCNRKCVWCDTDYALRMIADNSALARDIVDYHRGALKGTSRIILTGGEPTMQADGLSILIAAVHTLLLNEPDELSGQIQFHIESNGVRLDEKVAWLWGKLHQITLSPKPPSSMNPDYDWQALWEFIESSVHNGKRIAGLPALDERISIKPVIVDETDFAWIQKVAESPLRQAYFSNIPIILQTYVNPQSLDAMADLRGYWRGFLTPERLTWMRNYNVRLLPRLHNLIWGNEQGY